jgi:hypothetical protein
MMILLGYFLFAVVAAVTTSAVIGLILTNVIMGRFKTSHRGKKERLTIHRLSRLECFSRHKTQARLAGVLIRRR